MFPELQVGRHAEISFT
jgi:hypothetical protein